MRPKQLEITEYDDAGNIITTYIQSPSTNPSTSRIDVVRPKESKSHWQQLLDVFLPAGYPHSVTHDYLEYQIYDSLQAFSSSIAGLLSSRAVLSSVGVGDSTASPTAALLLSILQESAGRIATILFAHRFGTALEPECKMYRLLADVLNDLAFILDCLSPVFPKPIRVAVLSFSSVLRALCGVAAGSAKASLSAHFARWGNLGELNAKDSSQETVISLLGMLAGSVVVSVVTTSAATWATLLALLAVHLETNRRAVRAVSMRSLNRQRATLVFWHLCRGGHVPSPEEVAAEEKVFETDGVLRDGKGRVRGFCRIGVDVGTLLRAVGQESAVTTSVKVSSLLDEVLALYAEKKYILWNANANARTTSIDGGKEAREPRNLIVVLKKDASTLDVLTAWWQALALVSLESGSIDAKHGKRNGKEELEIWRRSMKTAESLMATHSEALSAKGWDLQVAAMETRTSARVAIGTHS